MKSVLEKHLQNTCEKFFPNARIVICLQQKKFADYSLDHLCHWAKAFDLDIDRLGKILCEALWDVKGVNQVWIEKSCYLNIEVDACIRYDLIFHQTLLLRPLVQHVLSIYQPNIEYAWRRLQSISEHIPFETAPIYPFTLKNEEKKILNCLDELLCVLQEDNIDTIALLLNDLANHIHGYLRTITLLCEDKIKHQFQIQLLKLSELMLKIGTMLKNPSNHRE